MAKRTRAELARELAKRKKWQGYSERAMQYCRDVVSGRIRACKWARMACQRHLDDLVRVEPADFDRRRKKNTDRHMAGFVRRYPDTRGVHYGKGFE